MPTEVILQLDSIFNLSERGIVFLGELRNGYSNDLKSGGVAKFEFEGDRIERLISGFAFGNNEHPGQLSVFIQCKSDEEITKIRAWEFEPGTTIKLVFP